MKHSKIIWTIIRIFSFILIGALNTVFISPENSGTGKNYAGYFFLVLAVYDMVSLFIRLRKGRKTAYFFCNSIRVLCSSMLILV